MNRKANLGQILESIPVLILVTVVMLIFVVVSSFISKGEEEKNGLPGSSIDSLVLLSVFLNTSVPTSEIGVSGFSGGDVDVRSLLDLASRLEPARQEPIVTYLYKFFNDFYSCNKQNKLLLVTFDRKSISKRTIIDYPAKELPTFPIREQSSSGTEVFSFCDRHLLRPGASEILRNFDDNVFYCVYVEAKVSC